MINRIINKLLCMHEWKYLGKTSYVHHEDEIPYKITERFICKKCGKFKTIKN